MRAVFAMRAEGAAMALLHTEQIMEMGAMGKMGGNGRNERPIRKKHPGGGAVRMFGYVGMLGLFTREIWLRLLPARGGC